MQHDHIEVGILELQCCACGPTILQNCRAKSFGRGSGLIFLGKRWIQGRSGTENEYSGEVTLKFAFSREVILGNREGPGDFVRNQGRSTSPGNAFCTSTSLEICGGLAGAQ